MRRPYLANIKRNSLDDGPGIRTTLFFKGCPLRCVWCHNPECIGAKPELLHTKSICIECMSCAAVCPNHAMSRMRAGEIDRSQCHLDGECVEQCPSGALERVGTQYSVDELVIQLMRDLPFYRSSGGGVTLSGGEATLYCEYAGEVSRQLRERDINVLLETCGHFDWERFEAELYPHLDTIYIDLKLMDPAEHRQYCGRGNAVILSNLERLFLNSRAEEQPDVLVRIPLIPGITATSENLSAASTFLRELGVDRVALLPYNPLWIPKSQGLGREPTFALESWMDDDELVAAREVFDGFEIEDH